MQARLITAVLVAWSVLASGVVLATPADGDAAASPATVLVAGGTGRTGQHVVAQLLERGDRVRVLTRSGERAADLFGDRVDVFIGDVRDAQTLRPAADGARFVISAVGSSVRQDPENSPEAVDYLGVLNLVEAAHDAGTVERFVLVSAMGAGDPLHPLNRFADNILLWKALGENMVRGSGLDYTIVRPGGLTDAPGGAAVSTGGVGALALGPVPRADVARVCIAALTDPAASRRTVEVVGGDAGEPGDTAGLFDTIEPDDDSTIF